MAHGQLFASANERIDGGWREAGRSIALCVHREMQIGDGEVLIVFVLTVHIHNLTDNAHGITHIFSYLRRTLDGDAYDDISAHLAGYVSRIVVLQSSVHQHHVTDSHWREGSRNGHRGTHGLRQPSTVEICAGKGDGQVA